MNTKHVPSLELCQEFDRLCKEKGIVVPWTEYVWVPNTETGGLLTFPGVGFSLLENIGKWECTVIPAPLVSEQGEWLHKALVVNQVAVIDPRGVWSRIAGDIKAMKDEANARQKMLNYLIIEGVITNL